MVLILLQTLSSAKMESQFNHELALRSFRMQNDQRTEITDDLGLDLTNFFFARSSRLELHIPFEIGALVLFGFSAKRH